MEFVDKQNVAFTELTLLELKGLSCPDDAIFFVQNFKVHWAVCFVYEKTGSMWPARRFKVYVCNSEKYQEDSNLAAISAMLSNKLEPFSEPPAKEGNRPTFSLAVEVVQSIIDKVLNSPVGVSPAHILAAVSNNFQKKELTTFLKRPSIKQHINAKLPVTGEMPLMTAITTKGIRPVGVASIDEVVDACLDCGADPDLENANGQLALHVAFENGNIAVVRNLIAFGCNVDSQTGSKRQTLLHIAAEQRSKEVVESLLAYGAERNIEDADGNTARHLAAIQHFLVSSRPIVPALPSDTDDETETDPDAANKADKETVANIVAFLHYVGAKRCPPGKKGCVPGCIHNGTFNGTLPDGRYSKNFPPSDPEDNPMASLIEDEFFNTSLHNFETNPEAYSQRLRMLCIDGGGIRGLMTVVTLRRLEALTGIPVYKCFDFLAGTSVGGMVALSLLYSTPGIDSPLVFSPNRLRNMQRLAYWMRRKIFVGRPPYDTEAFEKLLRKAFGTETELSAVTSPKVMVTSVVSDRQPPQLYLFRNYKSCEEILLEARDGLKKNDEETVSELKPLTELKGFHENKVWRAARATGAAPFYFRAFDCFLDGGLIANNPTADAISEVVNLATANRCINPNNPTATNEQIGVIISVGTGRQIRRPINVPDFKPIQELTKDMAKDFTKDFVWVDSPTSLLENFGQMAKLAIAPLSSGATLTGELVAASDGRPVERSRSWATHLGASYVRFQPLFSEEVGLDETDDDKLVRALFETQAYLQKSTEKMERIARVLRLMSSARK